MRIDGDGLARVEPLGRECAHPAGELAVLAVEVEVVA
jgi:hypothetical protein